MTDVAAYANLTALIPAYDSNAEEWWARYGPFLLADELKLGVALTQYHPLTFHLPGGNYTPDFLHIMAGGSLIMVEVKALIVGRDGKPNNHAQRGYRDARSKLRAAADVYRWLTWYEVRVGAGGAFELERIAP